MELSIVLSGPAGSAQALTTKLTEAGYTVAASKDHGLSDVPKTEGVVRAYRSRTSDAVPVVLADPDADRLDLDDAVALAESSKWRLRVHHHRALETESPEEMMRRFIREEMAKV